MLKALLARISDSPSIVNVNKEIDDNIKVETKKS